MTGENGKNRIKMDFDCGGRVLLAMALGHWCMMMREAMTCEEWNVYMSQRVMFDRITQSSCPIA